MGERIVRIAVALLLAQALGLGVRAAHAKTRRVSGAPSVTSKSPQAVAAFKVGRDLLDNARTADAVAEFEKALELDPNFALARAYLGTVTPGSEGLEEIERARVLAKKLPESERLEIQARLADKRGEERTSRVLWMRLSEVAAGDWHVHFILGDILSGERQWNQAAAALQKATALNPESGVAYNSLGYAYLNQDKTREAAAAFEKYSELRPDQPNPYDSLGEALMAAGRFDEAEASFRKALEISPQFHISWEGIALARFLREDWAGGREALSQGRAVAVRPVEKLALDYTLAWSQLAAGQTDAAWKTLDALEGEAQAEKLEATYAFVPIERANMLLDAGKPEAALEQVVLGLERGRRPGLSGNVVNSVRRAALTTRTAAEARLGKLESAARTLALLEADAKAAPNNAFLQSQAQFARGELALGRGDAQAAAAAFSRCIEQDSHARWRQAVAQEKAGDMAGAAQTRKRLLSVHRRDAEYVFIRAQLAAEKAVTKQGD